MALPLSIEGARRWASAHLRAGMLLALSSAWLAAGCALVDGGARVDSAIFDQVSQRAADQVRRCYRSPRVASSGRQITTRIRVTYRIDGGLAEMPVVVSQSGVTPANQPYAGKMAEAAGMAVIRCSPVSLPPELYEKGWRVVDLTFSHTARA
jgi:hypothetical protein